jgi:predicted helicase
MTSPHHYKTSYWIRKGIFDDLQSFETFEGRVNGIAGEKHRGDIFEIFVEGYLATQAIMQCVKHWVVGNIPLSLRERYKLPSDATGIDGIYETHDGSRVAYQVKYRRKRQLTFAEVAPFLGITEQFSDRVIFTNAATLSEKAVKRTRWVSREVFRALSPEALANIEAWIKTRPPPIVRAKPDPNYQVQALADLKVAFAKHDRATVVMACGTGKTLVALWAAEQETPKTVLVLVPSLLLLQQTLREWSEQTKWGSSFNYLCVCSDPTVGLRDDAINIDKSEVGFRIDTDPAIVRQFLERETTDIKLVFSTYQSSPVVGEGARGLPPFDIAIFDEAHKITGFAGTAFGWSISDQNIRIENRLFLTATPRHIDIRHRDEEGEFRVYSMDDESVYGPRAHTLSFATAVQKGIICPYKVIISLIDKETVNDFALKHGITIVKRDEIAVRWVANLIATKRAIEAVKALKIITFHSRVKLAKEFASKEPRGIATHLRGYDVRHVNGMQSSALRGDIMRTFAEEPKAILTNARCLTEGVNIPAVDMVAFVDPRQSRIDIAQAVGRAMRKPRGPTRKTIGYVVVPLFAGAGRSDSIEKAVKSEKFDVVADVLNALQEHDEELVDIIREIKERKGEGKPFNPRRFIGKVKVIGPRIDLKRLTKSIEVEIADRIGVSWDEWFGLLLRFRAREGHCRVPHPHVEGTFRLGGWVNKQRTKRDAMAVERRQRLDAIGFVWDPQTASWEEGFAALKNFKAREGHCRVGTFKLASGLVFSARIKTPCPLNAGSGLMQSDLFGIRLWRIGKRALRH